MTHEHRHGGFGTAAIGEVSKRGGVGDLPGQRTCSRGVAKNEKESSVPVARRDLTLLVAGQTSSCPGSLDEKFDPRRVMKVQSPVSVQKK